MISMQIQRGEGATFHSEGNKAIFKQRTTSKTQAFTPSSVKKGQVQHPATKVHMGTRLETTWE